MSSSITTPKFVVNSTSISTQLNTLLDNKPFYYFKGIFLCICVVCAIGGNILVCIAVFTERRLKRIKSNYFLVSLAVTDLLVACVVMPFAVSNELTERWMFGPDWCQIWKSLNMLFCTASILNLCVICCDRYIRSVTYNETCMTTGKAWFFITIVWSMSALVAFFPMVMSWLWTSRPADDHGEHDQCIFRINFVYSLFAASISFYILCLIMLVFYFKLFLFARAHAVRIHRLSVQTRGQSVTYKHIISRNKAAFTLGVVTGAFLVCWLPFFIIILIDSYESDLIAPIVLDICTWAGYINSCVNPIIYSLFNTIFQNAYKRILSGRCCKQNEDHFRHRDSRACSQLFQRTDFLMSETTLRQKTKNSTAVVGANSVRFASQLETI